MPLTRNGAGKPSWEFSFEMLDEQTGETFERTERRAVTHDRYVGLVVGADVGKIEANR